MKPKKAFSARLLKGRKVHEFKQPFGYPILLCVWEIREFSDMDLKTINEPITCKNCLAIKNGKRRAFLEC